MVYTKTICLPRGIYDCLCALVLVVAILFFFFWAYSHLKFFSIHHAFISHTFLVECIFEMSVKILLVILSK